MIDISITFKTYTIIAHTKKLKLERKVLIVASSPEQAETVFKKFYPHLIFVRVEEPS